MNKKEYEQLVKSYSPKETRIKNACIAFIAGGIIGFIGEVIINILMTSFGLSRTDSYAYVSIILILFATFMTAIGKFDNLVRKFKCGLIIPTTGFAQSVQSAAMDYRKEGLVTGIGANFFKLAGTVIVYGIVSAFILAIIKVILWQL